MCQYQINVTGFLLAEGVKIKISVFLHFGNLLPKNIYSNWAFIHGCGDLRAVPLHPFIYLYALMEISVLVEATEAFSSK